MKQFVKALISFPVLALLMFGIINQSLCGGEGYYMRFSKIEVALVTINPSVVYDTLYYTYPKKETVIDTTRFFELDSVRRGNAVWPAIYISMGIDYCGEHAGNIAYAAVEPGGGGFIHQLKSLQLFSIDNATGTSTEITNAATGMDSVFVYRWKQVSDEKFRSGISKCALSAYCDSFNTKWHYSHEYPGRSAFDRNMMLLFPIDAAAFSALPGEYHLKLRVEFADGLVVEPECTGRK